MPWKIVANDGRCKASHPYAVVNSATNRLVACHPSREDALRQLRALYANVPESDRAP